MSELGKPSLVAGEATTLTVTVELTKTPIVESVNATIGVQLEAMPVQPGEEGTSEGINICINKQIFVDGFRTLPSPFEDLWNISFLIPNSNKLSKEKRVEIAEKITAAVKKETTQRVGENGIDKLLRTLMKGIPGPLIKFVVNTLMWMDKHNIMPKAIVDLSPFHTSIFLTNLKSLGINHVFHHVYNFGTTGLFFAMGKEKRIPVIHGNETVSQKHMR